MAIKKMLGSDRFDARLEPELNSGCLLWPGAQDDDGYGRFYPAPGVTYLAHRYAYERANGPIPPFLCICHKCDVRQCVNPDHLFLGTRNDNTQDMIAKGRANKAKGERNCNAKLTEADVVAIRAALAGGESGRSLARQYSLTDAAISAIKKRVNWRHVQ